MHIIRYTPERKEEWNGHIRASRNGTFLFLREYMDYHSDRFSDHSLMYYDDKGRLLAVMPANESEGVLHSHQGLTYGGFVLSAKTHAYDVKEMFELTLSHLREHGFTEWHYKPVPTIYQQYPSQEDEYWLWRNGAEQVMCNLSCTVGFTSAGTFFKEASNARKHTYMNKLRSQGYTVDTNTPMCDFWTVLETNLQAVYGAKPVHTIQEIERLKVSFPDNILCVTAQNADGVIEAGVVLFISGQVVKTQYISASTEGKHTKALDFLILSLIEHYREDGNYHYFDLGTSNEHGGHILNESLILQKEGFGGRGVVYKGYKMKL